MNRARFVVALDHYALYVAEGLTETAAAQRDFLLALYDGTHRDERRGRPPLAPGEKGTYTRRSA